MRLSRLRSFPTIWRRHLNSNNSNITQKIEASIEQHTRVTRSHLTPELQLHLLTPDCQLYTSKSVNCSIKYFEEPFWAFYWPGGQALTRYILDEGPRLFPNDNVTKVLDIGSGCGAAAIAAKIAGASTVLANDIDEVACIAAKKNARLNNVSIHTSSDDLISREPSEHYDLILVGDLLYDEATSEKLEAWLDHCINDNAKIYLGDPGRHGLTTNLRSKLRHLRTYRLPENVRQENYGYDEAAVWQFLTHDKR